LASVPNGGDTHLALAFEGVPGKDQKDAVALAVLQQLLGGGAQYTRDGPGAGVQSRLNVKVVAPNKNVKSALTFNIPYSDTGLFGIYAQVSDNVPKVVELLVSEVGSVLDSVSAEELGRAKQLLKADLLTRKRVETLHFIGEQALAGSSTITTPEQQASAVDGVTEADIKRVARRVFSSAPTLCVIGDVSSVPQIDGIKTTLAKKTQKQ